MSELSAACADAEIDVLAFPLAYGAITVVVHPENGWVDYLTFAELRRIWSQRRKVAWSHGIRSAQGSPLSRWCSLGRGLTPGRSIVSPSGWLERVEPCAKIT